MVCIIGGLAYSSGIFTDQYNINLTILKVISPIIFSVLIITTFFTHNFWTSLFFVLVAITIYLLNIGNVPSALISIIALVAYSRFVASKGLFILARNEGRNNV
ncbi:hypothetical protein ACFL11_01455 [Patescibacteria group bacterium]